MFNFGMLLDVHALNDNIEKIQYDEFFWSHIKKCEEFIHIAEIF